MTTVTIIIDDPNGADTQQMFPGAFSTRDFADDPNIGRFAYQVYAGGAVDTSFVYEMSATGNRFGSGGFGFDLSGFFSSLNLVRDPAVGSPIQLMHADFQLTGIWATQGGVHIQSLRALTPDTLMNYIQDYDPANLVLIGNIGADTLRGSFLGDTLRGGAGGDLLIGGEGSDTASYEFSNAGVVINLLTGAATGGHAAGDRFSSIENILATNFADNITGNAAANFIDGAFGFDVIRGGGGDDFIFGRDGGGTLYGDAGNDRVDGGVENDTIYGGSGNDELRVGDGSNYAYGEDGNDNLLGASGIDRLYGGAGTDTLDGVTGNDILDGGTGADTMYHNTGAAIFHVDNAGDVVFDFATGDGDRVITTSSYTLTSFSGIEIFATANAADLAPIHLIGNERVQSIYGNAGANLIDGKAGADTMTGYGGTDYYYVDNAGDRVFEAVGGGAGDRVHTAVDFTLTANSEIELFLPTVIAGTGALNLTGNSFAQTIYGNDGVNHINGKLGADILYGRGGGDFFSFDTALGAANIDRIMGYSVAADTIRLENAVFIGLAAGVLTPGAFRIGAAAVDADDRIVYNSATGAVLYDRDGLGGVAAVQFAIVTAGLAMTNADFVVV